MVILVPTWSFKTLNRPNTTQPDRNALWKLIPQKLYWIKNRKKIWGDAHVPILRVIKISKWFTKCSDQESYSNRRMFLTFFLFPYFCVLSISKNNKVRNWKQAPKVAHIFHIKPAYILDWSTELSVREFCWTGC